MSHETDIAWMAGLFEGEGSITFHAVNSVELVLSMTDRDVIDRLQKIAGCGSVRSRKRPGIQETFVWSVTNKPNVTRLLWLMLPYFGNRRGARALEALLRVQNARDHGTAEVCGKGHAKVGDNLYVDPTRGWTMCKTCRRDNARAAYQAKKEAMNA